MTTPTTQIQSLLTPVFVTLPIDVVYLYGSRAAGHADALSDYDIGIVFQPQCDKKTRFEHILHLFGDIAQKLRVSEDAIDVVDLFTVPVLLQFNAISGYLLYNKNTDHRVMFETDVMRRYHDEHYYLDRYLQQTIAQLERGVYFEHPTIYA